MAQNSPEYSYCPYSFTYVPFLGGDTYHCLSKNHPKYKPNLYDSDKSREIAYTYYKEWCNTEKCFGCEHYPKGGTNSSSVFCKNCGEKTDDGRFCKHCGGRL